MEVREAARGWLLLDPPGPARTLVCTHVREGRDGRVLSGSDPSADPWECDCGYWVENTPQWGKGRHRETREVAMARSRRGGTAVMFWSDFQGSQQALLMQWAWVREKGESQGRPQIGALSDGAKAALENGRAAGRKALVATRLSPDTHVKKSSRQAGTSD